MIWLFTGSESGTRITKKLKFRFRIRIQGRNHNTLVQFQSGDHVFLAGNSNSRSLSSGDCPPAVVRIARHLPGGEPGGPEAGGGGRRRLDHPGVEDGVDAAGLRRGACLAEAELEGEYRVSQVGNGSIIRGSMGPKHSRKGTNKCRANSSQQPIKF